MNTAVSADGTMITFDQYGDGPPVIMTVGAFNTRSQTEPLARTLALRPRIALASYVAGGRAALDSLDAASYDVGLGPPSGRRRAAFVKGLARAVTGR